jgi:phosphatidylserine decarboxylase
LGGLKQANGFLRRGGWLPADNRVHRKWLGHAIDHIDKHGEKELIPVLREFKEMIEDNPRIYMYFSEMWDEIPSKPPYQNDPTGKSQIRNYHHMLQVLNHVFGRAPEWYVSLTPPLIPSTGG